MNVLRGFGLMGPRHDRRPTDTKLSTAQKATARDIVSRYDADSMSREDHGALRRTLRDAGIRPGRDLHQIFREAGIAQRKSPPSSDHPRSDSAGRAHSHGALDPEPPRFVREFRQKLANSGPSSADIELFADTLRTHSRSLRGNLIDEVA